MTQNQIWFLWAMSSMAQNAAFTLARRTRGRSLLREIANAIASNAIWIFQLQLALGPLLAYLDGSRGLLAQFKIGVFYTFFTVLGSVATQKLVLNEPDDEKYAKITVEDWELHKKKCGDCDLASQIEPLRTKIGALESFASCLSSLEFKAQHVADDYSKLDPSAVLRLTQDSSEIGE